MSVEAILTVLTLILAALAIVPRERAEDLQIRLGGLTRRMALVASLLVLYWALLEQIHALPGFSELPRPFEWVGNWQPGSLSLLALLSVTGLGYWSYRQHLPVNRLPRLTVAIGDALARRRYGEVIHLLETHLATIKN